MSVEYLLERDRWRCGICGTAIRRSAVYPDPMAPTIDHIVPLAAGGTHARENLQPAHSRCNTRKGDRGGGQLLLVG